LTEQTNKHTVKQIPRPSLYENLTGRRNFDKKNLSVRGVYGARMPLNEFPHFHNHGL